MARYGPMANHFPRRCGAQILEGRAAPRKGKHLSERPDVF
jgi:hypothetical protein